MIVGDSYVARDFCHCGEEHDEILFLCVAVEDDPDPRFAGWTVVTESYRCPISNVSYTRQCAAGPTH
jgi:hypothetical protein